MKLRLGPTPPMLRLCQDAEAPVSCHDAGPGIRLWGARLGAVAADTLPAIAASAPGTGHA